MTIKHHLLAGVAMTASEQRLGRYLRAPEGHESAPAPAPAPAPSEEAGAQEDFSAFEDSLESNDDNNNDNNDNKLGDDVDPAPSGTDDADNEEPPASDDQQGASVQERIDELTASRREAERALAEERRQREELAARLAKLEKPEGEKKERSPDERPNPDDYEFGEADGKFIEDLAMWRADQRFAEREREREFNEQVSQIETAWTDNVSKEETKTKYPDFDEKVTKGADRGDWHLSPVGTLLVKSSPVGADVAYHLAAHPEESKRIAALNPVEQAQEIGRLEGRYLNQPASQTPAKKASDAPPPPAARSRGAGGRFTVEADTDDFAAFDKMADGVLNKS